MLEEFTSYSVNFPTFCAKGILKEKNKKKIRRRWRNQVTPPV